MKETGFAAVVQYATGCRGGVRMYLRIMDHGNETKTFAFSLYIKLFVLKNKKKGKNQKGKRNKR